MTEQPKSNTRAIMAMCAAMALFVANDAFVKLAAAQLPTSQIMALRGACVVAIMLAAVHLMGFTKDLRRARQPIIVLRSFLEATVAFVFITALAHMGLAELTAIFLTAPLFMTAASAFVLKEKVGWRRWTAVVMGFVGMLIIVRPSWEGVNIYAILGVLSAAGAVTRDMITRKVDPATPSLIVSLTTGAAVAIAGLALAPFDTWVTPSMITWAYVVAAAIFVAAGNYAVIVAFRTGEVSAVSPFRYTVMLWALLAGYLVWREIPDGPALLGTTIIVASGLYVIHRERLRAAEATRATITTKADR